MGAGSSNKLPIVNNIIYNKNDGKFFNIILIIIEHTFINN